MQVIDRTPNQAYSRVCTWISSNDFTEQDAGKPETDAATSVFTGSKVSNLTSVSRMDPYSSVKVEERTDIVRFPDLDKPVSSEEKFAETVKTMKTKPPVRQLTRFSQYSPFSATNLKSASAPPTQFSVIVEGEESEKPSNSNKSNKTKKTASSKAKESAFSYKTVRSLKVPSVQPKTPESRPKKSVGIDTRQEKELKKKVDWGRIRTGLLLRLFFRGFSEMTVVTVVLFLLDVLVNSEQYGYQNYIFSS
ncbi:unnamed protein product [Acanthoscelides obtectus]|uniref:Uncharacterized protein n=1 Tax=Acanthoscelides obtectus TaxID=200917 RepID=A0A9P0KYS5_ACAOB|nr:unnamed protein product [Acanthoscelides obtectus]CAK1676325.1 hypothetical protein AOBTE_LOCUS30694 [Acanthoscelides obtectus]